MASLTRATPEVAPYPFTTTVPAPAMMPWEDVTVQLIDTPPITADYMDPHLHSLIRAADLALLMVDLGSDGGIEQCQEVLDRLGQTKTRLAAKSYLDEEDVGPVVHADVPGAEQDRRPRRGRAAGAAARAAAAGFCRVRRFRPSTARAWRRCGRRSTRRWTWFASTRSCPTAKEPDRDRPFTLRRGSTLLEMAGMVHKDFLEGLKFARVWGSAVHDGTQVKGDYVLHDKDMVELHM